MMKVFKYVFPIVDKFRIPMPKGSQLLTVQMQRGLPHLWALVDPDEPIINRIFRLAGTGHPIEEDPSHLKYIGSFQMNEEALIFHLFEWI